MEGSRKGRNTRYRVLISEDSELRRKLTWLSQRKLKEQMLLRPYFFKSRFMLIKYIINK